MPLNYRHSNENPLMFKDTEPPPSPILSPILSILPSSSCVNFSLSTEVFPLAFTHLKFISYFLHLKFKTKNNC